MAEKGWKQLLRAGMIAEPGNAMKYNTGSWRTFKPVWDKEKCIHCFICWMHCPDSSIQVAADKMTGIDYDHCKGCGICAQLCPKDCIKMEKEQKI